MKHINHPSSTESIREDFLSDETTCLMIDNYRRVIFSIIGHEASVLIIQGDPSQGEGQVLEIPLDLIDIGTLQSQERKKIVKKQLKNALEHAGLPTEKSHTKVFREIGNWYKHINQPDFYQMLQDGTIIDDVEFLFHTLALIGLQGKQGLSFIRLLVRQESIGYDLKKGSPIIRALHKILGAARKYLPKKSDREDVLTYAQFITQCDERLESVISNMPEGVTSRKQKK